MTHSQTQSRTGPTFMERLADLEERFESLVTAELGGAFTSIENELGQIMQTLLLTATILDQQRRALLALLTTEDVQGGRASALRIMKETHGIEPSTGSNGVAREPEGDPPANA